MFYHVKDLPFNARVSGLDRRFARLLPQQFCGPGGELRAAMQYFVQATGAGELEAPRKPAAETKSRSSRQKSR